MTREPTALDVIVFLLIFVVSSLSLHFGLVWAWPLALVVGFVLACFGVVVVVVVFDGDGDVW